jgi:hypothetical protein
VTEPQPAASDLEQQDLSACRRSNALVRICFTSFSMPPVEADMAPCAETQWEGTNVTVNLEIQDQLDIGNPLDALRDVVTARFVKDGQQVAVTPTAWAYETDCAGELTLEWCRENGTEFRLCNDNSRVIAPQPPITSASRFWPPHHQPSPGNPPLDDSCLMPGSLIRVRFWTDEYGVGEGEFVWSGKDTVFDVNFGPFASPPR